MSGGRGRNISKGGVEMTFSRIILDKLPVVTFGGIRKIPYMVLFQHVPSEYVSVNLDWLLFRMDNVDT